MNSYTAWTLPLFIVVLLGAFNSCTTPHQKRDHRVRVITDLPSNRPLSVQKKSDNHYLITVTHHKEEWSYYWKWWLFRVDGAKGKTITFEVLNKKNGHKWHTLNPLYMNGGDVRDPEAFRSQPLNKQKLSKAGNGSRLPDTSNQKWQYIPDVKSAGKGIAFTHTFTSNRVWIASNYPYLMSMANDLYQKLSAQAEKNNIPFHAHQVGETSNGRTMRVFQVGSFPPEKENPRPTAVLYAREHAQDHAAGWAMAGGLKYLLSDQPGAKKIRKRFNIFVIPTLDRDAAHQGVHHHICRTFERTPETMEARKYLQWFQWKWIDRGGRVDLTLSLHNYESKEVNNHFSNWSAPRTHADQIDALKRIAKKELTNAGFKVGSLSPDHDFGTERLSGRLIWMTGKTGLPVVSMINSQPKRRHLTLAEVQQLGRELVESSSQWLKWYDRQEKDEVERRSGRRFDSSSGARVSSDQKEIGKEVEVRLTFLSFPDFDPVTNTTVKVRPASLSDWTLPDPKTRKKENKQQDEKKRQFGPDEVEVWKTNKKGSIKLTLNSKLDRSVTIQDDALKRNRFSVDELISAAQEKKEQKERETSNDVPAFTILLKKEARFTPIIKKPNGEPVPGIMVRIKPKKELSEYASEPLVKKHLDLSSLSLDDAFDKHFPDHGRRNSFSVREQLIKLFYFMYEIGNTQRTDQNGRVVNTYRVGNEEKNRPLSLFPGKYVVQAGGDYWSKGFKQMRETIDLKAGDNGEKVFHVEPKENTGTVVLKLKGWKDIEKEFNPVFLFRDRETGNILKKDSGNISFQRNRFRSRSRTSWKKEYQLSSGKQDLMIMPGAHSSFKPIRVSLNIKEGETTNETIKVKLRSPFRGKLEYPDGTPVKEQEVTMRQPYPFSSKYKRPGKDRTFMTSSDSVDIRLEKWHWAYSTPVDQNGRFFLPAPWTEDAVLMVKIPGGEKEQHSIPYDAKASGKRKTITLNTKPVTGTIKLPDRLTEHAWVLKLVNTETGESLKRTSLDDSSSLSRIPVGSYYYELWFWKESDPDWRKLKYGLRLKPDGEATAGMISIEEGTTRSITFDNSGKTRTIKLQFSIPAGISHKLLGAIVERSHNDHLVQKHFHEKSQIDKKDDSVEKNIRVPSGRAFTLKISASSYKKSFDSIASVQKMKEDPEAYYQKYKEVTIEILAGIAIDPFQSTLRKSL